MPTTITTNAPVHGGSAKYCCMLMHVDTQHAMAIGFGSNWSNAEAAAIECYWDSSPLMTDEEVQKGLRDGDLYFVLSGM